MQEVQRKSVGRNGRCDRRGGNRVGDEEHTKEGYKFTKTPIMLSRELWETSGHWANYKENMYTTDIDDRDFAVKPMNCPGGMLVYKQDMLSLTNF